MKPPYLTAADHADGINVVLLRARLFDDVQIAAKIRREYGIEERFAGSDLEKEVFRLLGQEESDFESAVSTNAKVFEAAVDALGSNQRRWVNYRKVRPMVKDLLANFDPSATLAQSASDVGAQLKGHLRGQTSTHDAAAIMEWRSVLATRGRYQDHLVRVRAVVQERFAPATVVSEPMLTAGVAVCIGSSSVELERRVLARSSSFRLKAPGMGAILASEFLRNLGWSSFKPDTHVQRLFGQWFAGDPKTASAGIDARQMAGLLGSQSKDVVAFLQFARLGELMSTTVKGLRLNQVDQLVWLYGSMVNPATRGS